MTEPVARPATADILALGLARHRAGALAEAEALYAEAVDRDPGHAGAHYLLGLAASGRVDPAAAASHFSTALRCAPYTVDFRFALGTTLEQLGIVDKAELCYRQVLALAPTHGDAWLRLGQRLNATGRANGALDCHLVLADLGPDRLDALIFASDIARSALRFDRLPGIVHRLARRLSDPRAAGDWRPLSSLLYRDLFMPLPPGLWDALARRTGELLDDAVRAAGGPLPRVEPRPAGTPSATGRRLRIGYASANFGDHPIGHVTRSLFAAHDRGRIEVHGFSRNDRTGEPAAYARDHARGFDSLHQIGDLTPTAMADRIRSIGIDILIEIDGHMDKRGLETLAGRPAPVQAFWLGHAGGLGTGGADYLIADRIVVPPGEESRYREAVVRLPEVYHPADPHPVADDPGPRARWNLPDGVPVFCAFNNMEKVTEDVFRSWMRILARVPGSVVWLTTSAAGARMDNLHRLATAHGVAPGRLIAAPRVPDKALHLARHRLADLFLDTQVINASTTALDALWAGLPVLTVPGDRFSGRIAATMLTAIGLPDLICRDRTDYEERAVTLAYDPSARARLRERLDAGRRDGPLFDPGRFARHLEAAFFAMWDRAVAGGHPAGIDVPRLDRRAMGPGAA